jgi:anti-anti-sigma factor
VSHAADRHRAAGHHAADATLVVTRHENADGVWLRASGEIDVATVPVLIEQLRDALVTHDDLLVVDLGDVTFMGLAGVNALVDAYHSAPTRVRLGHLHPAVRRVLELTHHLDAFGGAS